MIKVTCQKCSKLYELEDYLWDKIWKCTCWELLEIKNDSAEQQLFTIWNYHQESLEFINNNKIELFGLAIFLWIISCVIFNYDVFYWFLSIVLLVLVLRIYLINYTIKKNQDKSLSMIDTQKYITIWIIIRSILIRIWIIFLWFLLLWLLSIPAPAAFISIQTITHWEYTPYSIFEPLVLLCTNLIVVVLLNSNYAFVLQNINITNRINSSEKANNKQTIWI